MTLFMVWCWSILLRIVRAGRFGYRSQPPLTRQDHPVWFWLVVTVLFVSFLMATLGGIATVWRAFTM
ncbi:MAG TPA: hypothetical protein VMI56_08660 [Reyranella sp.]|nr:hypothetical protein [Reyranella sp.]